MKKVNVETLNLIADKQEMTFYKFFPFIVLFMIGMTMMMMAFGELMGLHAKQLEGIRLFPIVAGMVCLIVYFVLYILMMGILFLIKSFKKFDWSMFFLGLFALSIFVLFILFIMNNAHIIQNETPLLNVFNTNLYFFDIANTILKVTVIAFVLFLLSSSAKLILAARK